MQHGFLSLLVLKLMSEALVSDLIIALYSVYIQMHDGQLNTKLSCGFSLFLWPITIKYKIYAYSHFDI